MEEDGKLQGLDAGKNRLEQRIVEIALVDVGAHVNAPHSGQLAGTIEFIDRAIREEHWQGQESVKSRRILHVRCTGAVVPGARELVRDLFISPMRHGAGERHGLHGGSLGVHVCGALLQVDDTIGQRSLETHFRLDIKAFFSRAIFDVEARSLSREHIKIRLRKKMCVNIDCADTAYFMLHTSRLLIFYRQPSNHGDGRYLKFERADRTSSSKQELLDELAVDRHVSSSIAESLSDQQVHPKPCEARRPTARPGRSSHCKASLSVLQANAPHQSRVESGRTSSFPRHRQLCA